MKKTVDEVLEHHGVKGQKWGVRKAATSGSSSGTASAKASSSESPRAAAGAAKAKQVLVDHAYAKRSAQIAGLSVLGIAAAGLAPGLLPAAVVAAAGGTTVLSAKVALAATVATRAAYVQNYISYAKRAKARVVSVAHADGPSDPTVEQVYNALTPKQKLSAHLLIEDATQGVEFADDPDVQDGWASMTPTERSVVLFLASGTGLPGSAAHSDAVDEVLAHHGIKGQKWGVRRPVGSSGLVSRVVGKKASSEPVSTGLKPRTGSADQIAQDRILKKIDTNGIHSLSNTELQSYTRRLQLEKDVNKALSEQSVATKAKTDGFIKRFIKSQGSRQIDRVVNKALDVAMEQAVLATGLKLHKSSKHFDPKEKLPSNLDAGKALVEVSKRMAPKKGK